MDIDITAPSTELGQVLGAELRGAGKPRGGVSAQPGKVVINLLSQPANTVLHDGWQWKKHTPARILRDTSRALADADRQRAGFIVHASFAFLRAAEAGATVAANFEAIVIAALEAEKLVIAHPVPSCVVRLGYLYGPTSRDLKAYRTAFRLLRPYWAGPHRQRLDYIHQADAARALLIAARRQPAGRVLHATDGSPASFQSFMDHFARLVGNRLPLHLPELSRPLARTFIAEEHMATVALGVHGPARPELPRFSPRFADYRAGLADVMAHWKRASNQGIAP
jgi:hypothetical protein